MRTDEIRWALSERDTLALTLLGEGRGEPLEGRVSIACVIRERAHDPKRWPDDIKGVCFEPNQFSCWNSTDPNYRLLMEQAGLLVEDYAVRSTFVSTALWEETKWIADGVLTGKVQDRVKANHYLTRRLWESGHAPTWAQGTPTFVGGHVFFYL